MTRVQRRVMAVLVGTQAAAGVGVAAGIAVSNLVAAELSGSDVIGGAASTAMVIGAAASSYVLARVADRAGRRAALSVGYGLSGIGAVGAAIAASVGSWIALLAALLPFGASIATGLAARFAATDLADTRRVGRELALVLWALTVGVLVGPNLAEPARRWASSWDQAAALGPYLLCAAAFTLALLGVSIGLRPDPLLLTRERGTGQGRPRTGSARSAWQALWSAPTARLAVSGIALCNLVMVGLMSVTPLYMSHGGASLRLVGLVISVHIAGMYALSPAFGMLADRWGQHRVLAAGAALLIGAGVTAGSAGGSAAAQLTVALVLLGLGWSAGLVGGSALLVDAVSPVDRPGVQGLCDVAMSAAGALGGVLAGVTVAVWSYVLLGLAGATLAALFVLAALLTVRRLQGPDHRLDARRAVRA